MALDWLMFALGVAVIGAIGIAFGLFIAGRATRWGDRRAKEDDGTFLTEVGPPEGDDGPTGDGATPEARSTPGVGSPGEGGTEAHGTGGVIDG